MEKASCESREVINASWFEENSVQGWFSVGQFILIWRNFCAGMIFSGGIHPDLLKSSGRDDFRRRKCILIWRKFCAGMISSGEMHPDWKKILRRDDFRRRNASWFEENVWRGWFPSEKFILIRRKRLAGMTFGGEMHPDLKKILCRDDFHRRNSSWFEENPAQGWFPAEEGIRNCPDHRVQK